MPKRVAGYLLLALSTLSAAGADADVLHLKDGGQVAGDVKRSGDGWNVLAHDHTYYFPADQVEYIELTSGSNGAEVAATHLDSLRRSVENLDDAAAIASRFQRFVDHATDPAVITEAKKDLAIWRDRVRQKMVKVGDQWVLPQERQKLVDQAMATTEQARQLVKQGRIKEADPLLQQALKVNPKNSAALYLTGVARYQQDQLAAARKSFEAVNALVPDHAPTLNNLAVVQWRQKQYVAALASYDAAMLAAPGNRVVLDNVASALLAFPPDLQKSPVYTRTLRRFQEQDQQLSEQLASQGLHRYGAIWLSPADMDQVRSQEKASQDKLDALSGEFDRVQARITELDSEMADIESQMHRMENAGYLADPHSGAVFQVPLPGTYYDLARDDHKMRTERASQVARLDAIAREAQAAKKNLPASRFAGMQKLIGAEGTPVDLTPLTTQPAGH